MDTTNNVDTSQSLCLNCDTSLTGSYCSECGQSASVERYRLNTLATEIYSKFRSVDATSTLRTFKELFLRPGDFVTSYLDGKRVGYTNPVTYFFYSFVIEVFVRNGLQWITNDQTFGVQGKSDLHTQLVTLISTLIWGTMWWLIFRKSQLNVVENAISAIYFVAQVNLYSLVLLAAATPFAGRYSWINEAVAISEVLIYLFYGIYFCRTLFGDPVWKLVPKQLLLSILYIIFIGLVVFADQLGTSLLKTE